MSSEVCLERDIEELHEDIGHVVAHPFLEDIHEKLTVLLTANGAFRYQVSGLRVEQAFASGLFAPTLIGKVNGFRSGALDDWNELHPLCAHFVAEEAVNRTAVFLVCSVDGAQDIEPYSMAFQEGPALHYLVEGSVPAAIDAVGVMD